MNEVASGPQIAGRVWNVRLLTEACHAGRFGPPLTLPMDVFEENAGGEPISREKVDAYKTCPDILAIPVVSIVGVSSNVLVDGTHRLTALKENGAATFNAYILTEEQAAPFRVPLELLQEALTFLLSTHRAASELLDWFSVPTAVD
jgi:hypothetical protein